MKLQKITLGRDIMKSWMSCNEISRRFDQKDFSLVAGIEQTILSAGNGQEVVVPEAVRALYKDLNIDFHFQLT